MKLAYSIILFLCSFGLFAQDISQWRGINRDGVYQEQNLQTKWAETGPELVWFTEELENGFGSPVISSKMLYINGKVDSVSHLFAYDLSGKLVWKSPNGKEFTGEGYSTGFPGTKSSPTIVDDLIYTLSGNGRLACFEKQNGKEKWAVDMLKDLKGSIPYFGYSESILTDGDYLYCFQGKAMSKLNRFTGKIVWSSESYNDQACYTSSIIIKHASKKILATFSNKHLLGIDTQNGKLLWSHKQEDVKYDQQGNSPLYSDGYIYYIAGEGNGAVKLKLSEDGKGIKEVWRNQSVKNNFGGFIKMNNYLYVLDKKQKLLCIDAGTGQISNSIHVARGSLIMVNDMLLCYSVNGSVSLVKVDGTKMEIVGKFKVEKGTKEHFAHPVVSNGLLFIRHGNALLAYDISEK